MLPDRMTNKVLRLAPAGLLVIACAAEAQLPRTVLVTREAQDIYRVGETGVFYIKTLNCSENVFGDRADLKLNAVSKGGFLVFRSGRTCVIQKFLQEVNPSEIRPGGRAP